MRRRKCGATAPGPLISSATPSGDASCSGCATIFGRRKAATSRCAPSTTPSCRTAGYPSRSSAGDSAWVSNRLPRQVKLFGAVSLLNDFASEMIYPLLPAFVTGVLGGGAVALGALDGAADAAAAFVKLVAGRLAARPARRGPLIVSGYFVAVVVRPVIAVTAAAWQVIGLRVVDRLGKGLRTPPRDALIADVTPQALRGRAFGVQRGLDHAGAVLGPIFAWWLLASGSANGRAVIAWSIVPGMLVLVLAMWPVKDGGGRWRMVEERGGNLHQPPPSSTNLHHRSPVSPLLAISFFYLLRMPDTLIILRSQELGVPVAVVPLF